MTDDGSRYEVVEEVPYMPHSERMFECPECEADLIPQQTTECSNCGSHLTLCWRVDAPAIGGSDD